MQPNQSACACLPPSPQGAPLLGECAAEFMVRMSRLYPGELVVLALGALTNLALAFHLDAGLPERLVSWWCWRCAMLC